MRTWGIRLALDPNVVQHGRCGCLEVYVSLRLSCWVVFALLFTAGAPAQETRVVLDRGGSTIVLEPYAPNIIRVTLSLLRGFRRLLLLATVLQPSLPLPAGAISKLSRETPTSPAGSA